MVTYDNEGLYIQSCTTIRARIVAIEAIIEALLVTAATAATDAHIQEYSLNTGQTQIKTSLRGASSVYDAIANFERLKNQYIKRLPGNGGRTTLVDGKNLIGPRNYR